MTVAVAGAFALALVMLAAPALATPCGRPDLLEAFPPDSATGVPTDATLSAHYELNADYLGEDVDLEHVGAGDQVVPASWDPNEGLLSIVPPGGLVAGGDYVVHWPSLRGINTASKGHTQDVHFTAGAGADQGAPSFAGVTSVDYDIDREKDDCTNNIEERYVFDLDLAPASDDGGRDALELVVFQTEGPGIDATTGPLPVRVSHLPGGSTVQITRSVDSATGHICFAALARDLTGKTSEGANHEQCIDTVAPPFFYGCSSAPSRRGAPPWIALGVVALAVARRKRR